MDGDKRYRNKYIIGGHNNLFLIPPHSGIILNKDTIIEEVAPCSLEDQKLTVIGENELISGESGTHPQLVKL
jgi:hypothetical protein